MAKTPSLMADLLKPMPLFSLQDAQGNSFKSEDFQHDVLVVMFICNHCPFVVHIAQSLGKFALWAKEKDVGVVAINANDVDHFPEDSPEKMVAFAQKYDLSFPYLVDPTQETAKAFQATCTPDFFVYDQKRVLRYRGQFCASRPGSTLGVTGESLKNAVASILNNQEISQQLPSLGCNIKWKPGNGPGYFTPKTSSPS